MEDTTTFLLIDDDLDDRLLFQIALEDSKAHVGYMEASGCNEALKLLENSSELPDYIFLDLNMPEIDGVECLSILKQHNRFAHIPVIIFSTSSDPEDVSRTRKLGAIDFVSKPSKVSELTNLIDRIAMSEKSNR